MFKVYLNTKKAQHTVYFDTLAECQTYAELTRWSYTIFKGSKIVEQYKRTKFAN